MRLYTVCIRHLKYPEIPPFLCVLRWGCDLCYDCLVALHLESRPLLWNWTKVRTGVPTPSRAGINQISKYMQNLRVSVPSCIHLPFLVNLCTLSSCISSKIGRKWAKFQAIWPLTVSTIKARSPRSDLGPAWQAAVPLTHDSMKLRQRACVYQ